MTKVKFRTLFGVFFLSLSLLVFELVLTRVYSATLFYHFAFMAISVAMLGLSAAALAVHFYKDRFQAENKSVWTVRFCILYGVSIFAATWIVFLIPVNAYLAPNQIAGKLVLIYALSALPFFFAGLVISGLFANFYENIGRLYAYDLIGAGVGAVLVIPLINLAGGEAAVLFVVSFAFISAWLFAERNWKIPLALFIIALLMGFTNEQFGWLRIQYTKGQSLKSLDVEYNEWNSYSRIMVIPFKPGSEAAYTWCPSPNYPLPIMKTYSVMIDDGASSPILPFDGKNLKPVEYLKYDLTSLSHRLNGDGRTLIIGSGGGRDVLTGLLFGAESIDAVDINPLIFEAMNTKMAEFAGNIYRHPKVEWYAEEGRAFARRHENAYDLIQIAMIDTWAATTAGAYSLSENTLYTVEAFQDNMRALKPGGMFSFTRFFFIPPRQALRLVSIFLEAAEREGVEEPGKCILAGMYESLCTIVFKNEPFTQQEIIRFKADLKDLGFHLVYAPDEPADPFFAKLVEMDNKQKFYDWFPYNVTPPTDDEPFFFNMLKLKDIMKVFEMREGQMFNYYATYTLAVLLIISVAFTLLVLIAPTLVKTGTYNFTGDKKALLIYFILIGLAYIMIEVALLQRFVLLLEHPAYAASGVIAGLLVASGLGSMAFGRYKPKFKMVVRAGFGLIALFMLIHILFGWDIIQGVIHLSTPLKILISMFLILPLGFAMGFPLPAGLSRAGDGKSNYVAWCWALNGSASVIASTLAIALAMNNGFTFVLAVGLGAYALSFVLFEVFVLKRVAVD